MFQAHGHDFWDSPDFAFFRPVDPLTFLGFVRPQVHIFSLEAFRGHAEQTVAVLAVPRTSEGLQDVSRLFHWSQRTSGSESL